MFIRGDEVHGAEIIRFLCIKGVNTYKYLGNDPQSVYFVENGEVICRDLEGFDKKYIIWDNLAGREVSWFNKLRNLQDWHPEDEHVTSMAEVAFIESYFQIPDMNGYELHNLRDMVVMYYSRISEKLRAAERNQTDFNVELEDPFKYTTAMQSITAIIDKNYYEA